MSEPLNIGISKFQRSIGNNQSIATYQQGDGVVVQLWEGQKLVYHDFMTYEEYAVYRADVPEYKLPDYVPPKITTEQSKGTEANGNTIGRVVGSIDSSSKTANNYNPPIDDNSDYESTSTKDTLDNVQFGLDLLSIIPGVGTVAGGANAAISLGRGNYTETLASAAAMIPFAGGIFKGGVLVGKASGKINKITTKINGGGIGKRKLDPRCILRPYKIKGKLTCPPPLTGHHVVPDRVFRMGPQKRIPGGISKNDGYVICVRGKERTGEHGQIHRIYDQEERVKSLLNTPKGTAPLLQLEEMGARAVSKVTKCNEAILLTQLRGYHASKGLEIDFIVRADPYGNLAKTIPTGTLGSKSNAAPGPIE
ncbi:MULTISPECIES: hypothetical protein [Pseudomonas]|uniref:Uncharacterized protein n=1 Tax=Pseudomonas capeferrum TaxID=1495066 RepID=A0ABY7REH1_9PSED|nr:MULTISPECIES: hypothetical protein [Pseudomonas]MUT53469.1 hypothetical protein [Pseudomonas sp. TDA1]WCI02194.1 hypothetical protein PMC74_10050 [Pseudomonas capeferrum]